MSKKHDIEYVRACFESEGYVLKSVRYKNNKQPLELVCPKGHKVTLSYTRFVSKEHRCPICREYGKKYSFNQIEEIFLSEGYKLTTHNTSTLIEVVSYVCPKKHRGSVLVHNFIYGKTRCPVCVGNARLKYSEVEESFKSVGYKLLSDRYINNKTPVEYRCDKGHTGKIRVDGFKSGSRCLRCSYIKRNADKRHTYSKVREKFKGEGYELLSKEYYGVDKPLTCRCPFGHTWDVTYHRFNSGFRCSKCENTVRQSKVSQEWLNLWGVPEEFREVRLRGLGGRIGFFADGFDPETDTVYEFLGDYWHGNPERFNHWEMNPSSKKSFGQLHQEWLSRKDLLEEEGYNVIYVWESEFNQGKSRSN